MDYKWSIFVIIDNRAFLSIYNSENIVSRPIGLYHTLVYPKIPCLLTDVVPYLMWMRTYLSMMWILVRQWELMNCLTVIWFSKKTNLDLSSASYFSGIFTPYHHLPPLHPQWHPGVYVCQGITSTIYHLLYSGKMPPVQYFTLPWFHFFSLPPVELLENTKSSWFDTCDHGGKITVL